MYCREKGYSSAIKYNKSLIEEQENLLLSKLVDFDEDEMMSAGFQTVYLRNIFICHQTAILQVTVDI